MKNPASLKKEKDVEEIQSCKTYKQDYQLFVHP